MDFPDMKALMCCNAMLFIVCYGRICSGQENFFAYMWQCHIYSKFRLCCFDLPYFIPNCFNSYGSSGREVEYQINYPKDVSTIPTHGRSSFNFHRKNLRKLPENLRKPPEHLRIIPKIAESSMDSLVLRHPIVCTEFNVRSFNSVLRAVMRLIGFTFSPKFPKSFF